MPSGKTKKAGKSTASTKFGLSSQRIENGHSSLNKQRDKRRKRKSIKTFNEEEEKYVAQLGTSIALLEQKNSRASTLSPDKAHSFK